MGMDDAYRRELEARKLASLSQVLLKTARLLNEAGLAQFQANPKYVGARMRHLAMMPHLDLEGTRVTELARRMEMTKQGIGQLVDELEDLGLVERVPDPEDGRAKLVRFTKAGRTSLLEGLSALETVDQELAEALGRAELTRLHGSLVKLLRILETRSNVRES